MLTHMLLLASMYVANAQVTINGVNTPVRDNILAYLQLDDEACDAPEWRVRRLFADANSQIREALEVVGYYNAGIGKQLVFGDNCWQANFVITSGKPVLLRSVSIEIDTGGAQDSELMKAGQACALNPGDVLQHANYDSCRRSINRAARDRGYFAASFTERRIDVYPDENAADIALHLATGPRYVFGEVTFDQSVLEPDLINRFVRILPGEPYDAERVRRLQRYLVTSTYFDQVRGKRDSFPQWHTPVA
mgnify:FL=1